jgi:hypothetical protein
MASPLITLATEYTPLPKPKSRFGVNAFGWLTRKKPEPTRIESQLPNRDWQELTRLWESTDRMLEAQRYPDQVDFKNVQRQMGKSMRDGELIRKVTGLNPRLVVQDSTAVKGGAAFYFVNPQKELIYTNASFTKGILPEFTIMKTDAADLPVYYPTYGWRTVLVRLLKGRYIQWNDVIKVFGDVDASDSRGLHWFNNIKNFKI